MTSKDVEKMMMLENGKLHTMCETSPKNNNGPLRHMQLAAQAAVVKHLRDLAADLRAAGK